MIFFHLEMPFQALKNSNPQVFASCKHLSRKQLLLRTRHRAGRCYHGALCQKACAQNSNHHGRMLQRQMAISRSALKRPRHCWKPSPRTAPCWRSFPAKIAPGCCRRREGFIAPIRRRDGNCSARPSANTGPAAFKRIRPCSTKPASASCAKNQSSRHQTPVLHRNWKPTHPGKIARRGSLRAAKLLYLQTRLLGHPSFLRPALSFVR